MNKELEQVKKLYPKAKIAGKDGAICFYQSCKGTGVSLIKISKKEPVFPTDWDPRDVESVTFKETDHYTVTFPSWFKIKNKSFSKILILLEAIKGCEDE